MANNEDYLDSLLKAAEEGNNPDSAINKVKELSRKQEEERKQEEKLKAEAEAKAAQEKADSDIDDLLKSLAGEDLSAEVTGSEESSLAGDMSVAESSVGGANVADVVSEEAPIEEIVIEDSAEIAEAELEDDIDALLKSGFSGEVEVDEDIASLLENAEKFAQEASTEEEKTAEEEKPSEEEMPESTETVDTVDSAESSDIGSETEEFNIDEMLGMLSEEEEKSQSDSEDPLGGMSAEELDAALSEASKAEEPQEEVEIDLSDLEALESEFGIREKSEGEAEFDAAAIDDSLLLGGGVAGVGGLGDLSELLLGPSSDSSESEAVEDDSVDTGDIGDMDMLDLINDAVSKQEAAEQQEEQAKEEAKRAKAESEGQEESGKKKKKGRKPKKEEKQEGEEEKPKKETFFTKLIDFLTREDEPEEDLLKPTDGENGFEDVQGENKDILNAIDSEGEEKKGKKKKKGKKGKEEPKSEDGDEDEDGEGASGKDKKKKKKEPKEKKEKKPLVLDIDTGKPLSKRNVILIFVMCLTLMLAIIFVCKLVPAVIINANARTAYYKGDYETTYQSFYGEKLSASDEILFNRSAVILKMAHKYDAYAAYMNMNKRTEALDQLLQGVDNYEAWLYLAAMNGCEAELTVQYTKVLGALLSTFGLDETDAKAIIAMPTDLEYSLMCESIANGTRYIDPNEPLPGVFVPPMSEENIEIQYEDVLPEEGN